MKNMALKKPMMLGEDVVANVGFSGKGITEAAKPEYPYCLKLYLSQQELDMLEIEDLPVVGTMLKLNAKVLVSSTRSDVELGNTMELQITEMELGSEKKPMDAQEALYGKAEQDED